MFTAKLNLRQLVHSQMTTPKGNKVLVIPIAENNLFEGEKGLYLDLVGFERKEVKEGEDTHLIKQSFSKEKLAAMTDEQKKALPILGNARLSAGQRSESEPKDANGGKVAAGIDGLPF
jgi:hypothetical protein